MATPGLGEAATLAGRRAGAVVRVRGAAARGASMEAVAAAVAHRWGGSEARWAEETAAAAAGVVGVGAVEGLKVVVEAMAVQGAGMATAVKLEGVAVAAARLRVELGACWVGGTPVAVEG